MFPQIPEASITNPVARSEMGDGSKYLRRGSSIPSACEILVMTPTAWRRPFDLQLQTYLYEIYHAHWLNRGMHFLTMGPIVWGQFLLLPSGWRWPWAFALAVYYILCLGFVGGSFLGAVVLGMCQTATFVEDAFALGCVLGVGLNLLQTLTHRFEDRMPPIANGHRRTWLPAEVYYPTAPPLFLARNFLIGFVLEFLASPKLLAVQAVILINKIRPSAWWTDLQDVVKTARRDPTASIDRVPGFKDLEEAAAGDSEIEPDEDTSSASSFVLASLLLPFVVTIQVILGLLARAPSSSEDCGGPEPVVLEDIDEMRRYVRRSEPFIVRGLATAINELEPPQSSARRGEVVVDHDARDFPALHAFVRRLFGHWRWMLSHKPLWFTGSYEHSSAHIDYGIPTVNFYCLKQGSKRVVLFPHRCHDDDDLVLGSDQLYIPGSHDGETFDAWLNDAKQKHRHVYDFHLRAGEALFFNSSASVHRFTNLEPDCAAYSMRLTTLTVSPLVESALVCGPFKVRWQATLHSLADILNRQSIRVIGEP